MKDQKDKKELLIFGSVFSLIWAVLFIRAITKHGLTAHAVLFMTVSLSMLFFTVFRRDILRTIKNFMSKLIKPVGVFLTAVMMTVVFYLIFAPVGIIMRLLGKDVLDMRIEPKRISYWNLREKKEFDKQQYFRQF